MRKEIIKELKEEYGDVAESIIKDYFEALRHELSTAPYVKIYVPNFGTFHPTLWKIDRRIKEKIQKIRKTNRDPNDLEELRKLWEYRKLIKNNKKIKKQCRTYRQPKQFLTILNSENS